MTDVAIQTKGLTKAFRDTSVLKGVDLLVRRGEIFVLLGSNGPGTTTTVNILATLGKPDSGKARVCGFDARSQPGQCAEHST
jgi:ABC-2 type transport system ATP-binding protein